jgi:PAS domain S-box-containing protein
MKGEHSKIITELGKEFKPVLSHSPDGVYLWLDDENMICNEKFAKMLGYTVREIQAVGDFLGKLVAEKDQQMFANNYRKTIAALSSPVRFKFQAVKKDGSRFSAETDMIPITFKGHAIAYHFVRKS